MYDCKLLDSIFVLVFELGGFAFIFCLLLIMMFLVRAWLVVEISPI